MFSDEHTEPLKKGDTAEEETRESSAAREALDRQSTFVRRVIAGAYRGECRVFLQERGLPEHSDSQPSRHFVCLPTTSQTYFSHAFDSTEWQTTPSTFTFSTV